MTRPRLVVPAAIAIGLAALALYVPMAARDVTFGDGPELTAAAILGGVGHPPGYPLWIVLGHLASLLPLGPLPFRVNLTAAFYHAGTLALVFASGFVLVRRVLPALAAAILLGIGSPLFVSWSLQAEVFSLNDLLAAAIVLSCTLWIDDPKRWRLAVPLGALFGLGLANQQTLIMLAPLPLWAAWHGRSAWYRAEVLKPLAAALLSVVLALVCFALPYVHTLLASQHLTTWVVGAAPTLRDLLDVIDRRVFGGFNLVPMAADQGGTFFDRAWAMLSAAGLPALLIVAGVLSLGVRRRFGALGIALLVVAFPFIAFCAVANINVHVELLRSVFSRFALLPLVALAPFAACAFDWAATGSSALRNTVVALLAAFTLAAGVLRLPKLDLAYNHDVRTFNRDVFAALPRDAIVLTAGDPIDGTIVYFQQVEGWRPDVTQIAYGLLAYPPYAEHLAERIVVPATAVLPYAPTVRRDAIVAANPRRPFYTVGERGIHAPGPAYHPSVLGIVSRMIPNAARVDPAAHFREETRLQAAPGYGSVPAERWQTNGFGTTVREYYAGGFFTTGYDAERLGNLLAARYWYRRALEYYPDPMIQHRIDLLGSPR